MATETNGNETECVSPEADRAGQPFLLVSGLSLAAAVVILGTGFFLWWRHRKNVFLTRRNPGAVSLLGIAVIANLFAGPIYRLLLNSGESFFTSCFFGNSLTTAVVPMVIAPTASRIVSFHFRVSLHKKLSKLHKERQQEQKNQTFSENLQPSVVATPPANPILFRDKMLFGDKLSSGVSNASTFSQLNRLKYRAGSRFSIVLAMALILLTATCGLIYGLLSCPVPIFGLDNCAFGFIEGAAVFFFVIPLIPILFLILYFGHLIKQAPDPFRIKHEIKVFFGLLAFSFFFGVLGFLDLGGFSKDDEDDLNENINFKWVQILDIILLVQFVHAVHVQVFHSIEFEKSLNHIVPVPMSEILERPEGRDLFEAFLQADFSVENLLVYEIMESWRKHRVLINEGDGAAIAKSNEEARRIYRNWLDPENESAVGVNVGYEALEKLRSDLDSKESYSEDLFTKLADEVFLLMQRDSFVRFINTEEYKVFVGAEDPRRLDDYQFDYRSRQTCCFS